MFSLLLSLSLLTLLTLVARGDIVLAPCDPVFYPEGCPNNELPLKRVSYVDNPRRELSLYMHTVSAEMLLLHVLVVFADPDHEFHNTLLLNPARLYRLQGTLRESRFRFNNEVLLMSKGHRLLVQYDVADWNCSYFVPLTPTATPYDAALLMDPYSSMWHEYNTLITERAQLLLRYSYSDPPTREDFQGLYAMQCDVARSRKRCHVLPHVAVGGPHATRKPNATKATKAVKTNRFARGRRAATPQTTATTPHANATATTATTTSTATTVATNASAVAGLWINGVFYAGYELVIDPSVSANRLPHALYMRWHYHAEREMEIAPHKHGALLLHLNEQFQYELAPESHPHELVVGVDALHYFQKTEHRLDTGVYLFYYTHIYSANDEFVFSKLVICVFIKTLLVCLFHWVTSDNYDVLQYLLRTPKGAERRRFKFNYRQVACEWTAVGSTVLLWILTLIFTEPVDSSNFLYSHTAFQQRKVLLYVYSFYHFVVLVGVLGLNWPVTRKSAAHYYYWACTFTSSPEQRDWAYIQLRAHKRTSTVSTKLVMIRNLTLHTLLDLDLLFIMNYMAEEKLMYGFFYLLITLALFYYYVKYLLIATLYAYDLADGRWSRLSRHAWFVAWLAVSTVGFVLYAALSVPSTFVSFAQDVNSTYSETLIVVFVILFLALVCLSGMLSVVLPVESHVKRVFERVKRAQQAAGE